MFEDKVSVFESFHSSPKTITLGQWLNACKNGSRYTNQVLEYRRSNDEQHKKNLPLATVGAVCSGGRKLENVINRTGWIALDIDGKDNPHLTDAEHIRDEVAKIKNVAFAGLSASGAGVWALVKVANPERQAEHFEMLIKDFEGFGIVLDSTKGKNPNDARFYSYDSGAIIKESYTIYNKLPPRSNSLHANKISPDTTGVRVCTNYSRKAFENEINILSSTQPGNRNNQLFKSSASLAELVAGGLLDENEVRQALEQTALSIGLKSNELNATIKSGFDAGKANPRIPVSIGRNSVNPRRASKRDSTGNGEYESQNSEPNDFNPYTGEVFDNRGYPASWDETKATEAEYTRAMDADPMLEEIHKRFKPKLITEP